MDKNGQPADGILHGPGAVRLTPGQEKAIIALIARPNTEEAAAAAKVNPRTIRRWLAEPAFVAAYLEARRRVFDEGLKRLETALPKAVAILTDAMEHGPDQAQRLRAANHLLRYALKAHELLDLGRQLEEIQAELAAYREQNHLFTPPARGAGFN
jgi:hypothetical protein